MLIRLAAPTGEIADDQPKADDSVERIVRSAILIHSGPNGESTDLTASNGDISFDEARIQNVVSSHNEMISSMAVDYGGFDKVPTGAYPPVLDQHNDDSNDRIRGRLTGLLRFERRDVPKVGKNVACALADITFLGADTVSKVKNGLIYHISVGINEESDTLGEVSCVIEPAAPGAMVLNKRKALMTPSVAEGDIVQYMGVKCKVVDNPERQGSQVFIQIPGVGRRLVKIEKVKKLKGARVSKTALAKLKKLSGELNKLSATAKDQKAKVNLAKRKIEIKGKLTKLMADRKMTPAEFKKIDLLRLSKLDESSLETVIHMYDVREAQVSSGQQGTVSAAIFSDVSAETMKDRDVKRFKLAAKKNLSKAGVKFKADEKAEDDKADKKLAIAPMELPDSETAEESTEDVQGSEEMMQQIEENATQIARVASALEEVINRLDDQESTDPVDDAADKNEAAKEEETEELSADDKKEDDKKELAEDDKPEDDKEESK